jgi:hypothetical protein
MTRYFNYILAGKGMRGAHHSKERFVDRFVALWYNNTPVA